MQDEEIKHTRVAINIQTGESRDSLLRSGHNHCLTS